MGRRHLKQSRPTELLSAAALQEIPPDDRRREPRRPATGEVQLQCLGMADRFAGQLLDTTPSGFRVRHSVLSLTSGRLVHFEFGSRGGLARAVWTRILDGGAETGFHILSQVGG
jgi:hypothetical protein